MSKYTANVIIYYLLVRNSTGTYSKILHVMFLIYVNDIPKINNTCKIFYSNITFCRWHQLRKSFRNINDPSDSVLIKQDIDSLSWTIWTILRLILPKVKPLSENSKISTSHTIKPPLLPKLIITVTCSWASYYSQIYLGNHTFSTSFLRPTRYWANLIRHTFSTSFPVNRTKQLYISLQSQFNFMYCYVLWEPHLVKHIQLIDRAQQWATKCISNDYNSDYKSHLSKLRHLHLMYTLDLNDIMFFIKNLKTNHDVAWMW